MKLMILVYYINYTSQKFFNGFIFSNYNAVKKGESCKDDI